MWKRALSWSQMFTCQLRNKGLNYASHNMLLGNVCQATECLQRYTRSPFMSDDLTECLLGNWIYDGYIHSNLKSKLVKDVEDTQFEIGWSPFKTACCLDQIVQRIWYFISNNYHRSAVYVPIRTLTLYYSKHNTQWNHWPIIVGMTVKPMLTFIAVSDEHTDAIHVRY